MLAGVACPRGTDVAFQPRSKPGRRRASRRAGTVTAVAAAVRRTHGAGAAVRVAGRCCLMLIQPWHHAAVEVHTRKRGRPAQPHCCQVGRVQMCTPPFVRRQGVLTLVLGQAPSASLPRRGCSPIAAPQPIPAGVRPESGCGGQLP